MVTMLKPIKKGSVHGQVFWQLHYRQKHVIRTIVRLKAEAGPAPPGSIRAGDRPAWESLH